MKKIFTLLIILMLATLCIKGQKTTKTIDINGGDINIMGTVVNVPDYTKWYYFSFETGTIVGNSDFTLENVNENSKIGTEIPSSEWSARTDWDIAFHATDIRTNGAEAVKVADSESSTDLDDVYSNLIEIPTNDFAADKALDGVFIASMSSMPPTRATSMSACEATHGWATFSSTGGTTNPTVAVFKLADGKHVKVYLKKFFSEENNPGYIEIEYETISAEDPNKNIIDINGGNISIMGTVMNVPDYTKWYYFSFETGEVIGSSDFTLADGEEIPSTEWEARNDWDIAFHATDIRTNNAKAILIADTTSTKPLDKVFEDLTNAPAEGYSADEEVEDTFIASMNSMPPVVVRKMSICKATHGWANFGMSGNSTNPSIVVFKLSNNDYVKVYLKEFFNSEGNPGYIEIEYKKISVEDLGITNNTSIDFNVYPNPASDILSISTDENATVYIYNIIGVKVKEIEINAGISQISVSDLVGGTYLIRLNNVTKKLFIK